MEQPIRYVDLIQPDDSISTLIKQLDEANDAYNNLGASIKAEASRISAAMTTISGATNEGRAATRGYSEDAQKLLKAERDLNFARSETARKIAELKMLKKDEQTIQKLTIQLNRASAGSYEALSAQYSLNKIRLNAMTEEYRKNTEEGRKLEAETRDIYDRMNELQKATGKYTMEVGNYEKAVGQMMGVQGRWLQNLEQLNGLFANGMTAGLQTAGAAVSAFGKKLLALLANPIVAVIAAIAAAFMALKEAIASSEENTRTLTRVLAPFQRILSFVLDTMQSFAGWILKAVEGMENLAMAASRWAERLPLVGNALRKVNNELENNIRLEKEKQAITDANRKLTVKEAKTEYEISVLRRKAAQTNNPKEQAALLSKAIKKEKQLSDERVNLLTRELIVMKEKAKQSQNDAATNEAIAQKEAEIWRVRTQREQASLRMVTKLKKAQDKMNNPTTPKTKDNTAEEERRQQQLLALIQKNEDIRISMYEDGFSREYATIVNNYDKQIAALVKMGNEDITLRSQANEQIELLEKKKVADLADLTTKYMKQEVDRLKKEADAKKKAAEETYRTQVDVINKQAQLDKLQIDNMQASSYNKERMSLEAEKKRLKAIYDLNVKAGKDLNSLEMKILREQMNGIDKAIKENKPKDVLDMMGLNLNDDQKQVVSESFSFALDQLNSYMDAWAQAAERKVALADKEVESAQKALDAEREARANGYASNVEYAQKELENAKKNQQAALREQEKAQRAKIALDTIMQASNLITATALIFSQFGNPFVSIPMVSLMWGAFAAAKIKAMQVTKQGTEEYGEGTVELLQGGSHQSGNDIDLGTKKDGTRRRAEGGEFFAVINKRNSRKYRQLIPDVIHAFNSGTFEQKYANAYKGAGDIQLTAATPSADLGSLKSDVSAIREQGERSTYTDGYGTHIVYKNLHRVILN